MDCYDCCTYTEDTTYVAQDPAATDVVVEFPALDTGTAVTLPAENPADWGLTTAPVTTPAPSIPTVDSVTNDMLVQSITNDMYIDAMNQIDIPMMNLTSPYGPDYTATYDSTTNSTGWVKDGDLTPSTPTTSSYDDN
jgi:hypothetical protein